jgi:hypothetical protein
MVKLVEPSALPPAQAPLWSKVEEVEPTSTPGKSVAAGAGVGLELVDGVLGAEPQPARATAPKTLHSAVKCFEREETVIMEGLDLNI